MPKRKRKRSKTKKTEEDSPHDHHLPEELIIENILTRLPARNLGRFNSVSKLWYNSINDTKFAASHFAQQQQHSSTELKLVFNLLNIPINNELRHYFFSLEKDKYGEFLLNYKLICGVMYNAPCEPVGYCNGLACVNLVREENDKEGGVAIVNPSRGETLTYHYSIPSGKYLCHGFGFDLSSNAYKVVVIYTTVNGGGQGLFICMVITLGTKSWRKSVTSTSEMSLPPGCSPFPDQMVTRAWKDDHRSATLCGGDLVWTITNSSMDGYKIEMLLSFDIHNEKIQFIQLPTECCPPLTPAMMNEHLLEVDHHILEFKGYPCVARCEKILVSDADHQHQRRRRCKHQSGFCCYRFKIHLYILKDKVKQIWVKEETFDVPMEARGLVNHPFCCYFATTSTPPTRMLSFSDQVILYWFDGECLVFYNLQMKQLKVVNCSGSGNKRTRDSFTSKMKEVSVDPSIGEDENICLLNIDYQLNAHVENILSLKTFIPEGQVAEFDCFVDFVQSFDDKYPVGWVTMGLKSPRYYSFY